MWVFTVSHKENFKSYSVQRSVVVGILILACSLFMIVSLVKYAC